MPTPPKIRLLARLVLCGFLATVAMAQVADEVPADLRCRAGKVKPALDFEYRFVMGYTFSLPIKQFWGRPVGLDLEMEVEPINGTPGEPGWMDNRVETQQIVPSGLKGDMHFTNGVSVGLGEYRIHWKIRDDAGRTCQGSGDFRVALSRSHRAVTPALQPGEMVGTRMYLFRQEEAVSRPFLGVPRRLKVFVSMDVTVRRDRRVRPNLMHSLPLFAALRQLGRSSSFNEFSVVVFSFEDQKVLLRHDYQTVFDFPALRNVIGQLQPDTVDVQDLARGSEMQFFEELLVAELRQGEPPDGVVFVGREMNFGKRMRAGSLDLLRRTRATFAFFDASPWAWKGAIGNFIRAMMGKEYSLRTSTELAKALKGFESQVLRARGQ